MKARIAINGRYLTRRITGVERYAHEISSRLSFAKIIQPGNNLGQISGNLWEQIVLPMRLEHDKILWSPANAGPWMVSNQVITIHDASVFDHPEWFKPSFVVWTRLSWKVLAKRVKAIITVSNFSRERLIHHLRVPEHKVHVIPNGVGKPFEAQSKRTIDQIQKKYKLNGSYFFFVGTHEPRKNLRILYQAWNQKQIVDHKLIVAGTKGTVFAEAVSYSDKTDNIKWLGYIPEIELPPLYAGATAVIVPSYYEGFGLTALEAMACGAPVIVSDTAAFPETVGEAALLINPNNPNELATAMYEISENKALARSLRERGLQRAAKFSWDNSASKTQSLLESFI